MINISKVQAVLSTKCYLNEILFWKKRQGTSRKCLEENFRELDSCGMDASLHSMDAALGLDTLAHT